MQKYKLSVVMLLITWMVPFSWSRATGPNIIISAVSIVGDNGQTDNDYIELFNPGGETVNLKGYRLVKRTATGTADASIKSWTTDTLIGPYGFYLWANTGAVLAVKPDGVTSATLSENNGVALRFGALDSGQIIDALSWGTSNNGFTNMAGINPKSGQVLVRTDLFNDKIFSLSPHSPGNSLTPPQPPVVATPAATIIPTASTQDNDRDSLDSPEPFAGGITADGNTADPSVVGALDQSGQGDVTGDASGITTVDDGLLTGDSPQAGETIPSGRDDFDEQIVGPTVESSGEAGVPDTNQIDAVTFVAPPAIRINELLPNPIGVDAGAEWVELYNFGTDTIDLMGYVLDDIGSGLPISSNAYRLPELSILPGSYLLVTIPANKFTMNNTGGDALTLLDPQKQAVDNVSYSVSAGEGQAYARFDDGWLWVTATPGLINAKPESTTSIAEAKLDGPVIQESLTQFRLSLNELYPYPKTGEQEFVELYNKGDAGYLTGYILKIGNRTKSLSKVFASADSYVSLTGDLLPVTLSNDGQTVSLLEPNGSVIDAVIYPKSPMGESLSKIEDNWLWTLAVTPNLPNEVRLPNKDATPLVAPSSGTLTALTSKTKKVLSKPVVNPTKPQKTAFKSKTAQVRKTIGQQSNPVSTSVTEADQQQTPDKPKAWAWILLAAVSVGGGMYVAYRYALKDHWQF